MTMTDSSSDEETSSLPPPGFIGIIPFTSSSSSSTTTTTTMTSQCKDLALSQGTRRLEARCVDERGQMWFTGLDLNLCVGVLDDGAMVFQTGGNFESGCDGCTVVISSSGDLVLECSCVDSLGAPTRALLPLSARVAHDELAVTARHGRLGCGLHWGDASPDFSAL
ncbi:hypothetical protein XA68_10120 [Ophiocordyceps unilateralis]|uniref:Cyanovirin-N domain-containing protein n=1 Tax=Ophiocordyceps unilateralis TaxID=268505 RepID=A0A2A9P345_OPHUN|nr:hypothetical protein XA68_10120 [Ophiocordyceps unilateralis]